MWFSYASVTPAARASGMAAGLIGSEILRIASEIRGLVAQGRTICNLTVGDFDPRCFPVPEALSAGTRDALAELRLLQPLIERLGARATLRLFEDADHSFHVPARTGRKDADVRREMLDAIAAWIDTVTGDDA